MHLDGRTIRTPTEHRAVVSTCGARRGNVLAWPTAERLRHDLYRLGLLVRWRDLMEPPSVGGEPDPADDGSDLVNHRADRPTLDEMSEAAGRGPYVVTRRDRRGSWRKPVRHPGGWSVDGTTVRLGELVFVAGELMRWGFDRHGRPLTPFEKLTMASRGARRKEPPGTRWRKAVDTSGDWDSLHFAPCDNLEIGGGNVFDAIGRRAEANTARRHLGPLHAEALDLAIGSATAQAIGEAFGHAGEYAKKKGVRLVNEAIDVFGEYSRTCEVANDNIPSAEVKIAA